jgi:hypothetical protein
LFQSGGRGKTKEKLVRKLIREITSKFKFQPELGFGFIERPVIQIGFYRDFGLRSLSK